MINKKILKFHTKNNDYFGTLATVLSLIEQDLHKKLFNENHSKILKNKIEELMYLQNNFKITK